MRWLCFLVASATTVFAQVAPPNAAGVSLGHIHLTVPNPDAQIKVWQDVLGGTVSKADQLNLVKLPGIFIIVTKADATLGSEGSTVNHFGFLVKDYADIMKKVEAANLPTVFENEKHTQRIVNFPDNVHVELTENTSIDAPVIFHHIHIMTTDPEALQAWYVKTFGAEAGTRGPFLAAKLPGGEVDFIKGKEAQAPTKGRALDHIGFEIKDLAAFCKQLEANGVKFDMPLTARPAVGLTIAYIFDPIGTRIELTQGLVSK